MAPTESLTRKGRCGGAGPASSRACRRGGGGERPVGRGGDSRGAVRARARGGARQRVHAPLAAVARLHRRVRLDRVDLPGRCRGGSRRLPPALRRGGRHRCRVVRRPVRGRRLVAWGPLGWTLKASLIAGTALSTTSLAVVYAVLVETRLNTTSVGKLLMSACFVTDLGTALALSAIFIKPNAWFPAFLVGSIVLIVLLPRVAKPFFRRYGDRVIEPEIKLAFVCLFALMVLADASKGHAVLPAFVLGLAMSRHYRAHRQEQERLRVVAFAFLTPFFFLKGG